MYLQSVARMAGIVATLTGPPPTASRQVVDGPHIVVHVVNEAGALPEVTQTARSSVTSIYKSIGVAVVWIRQRGHRPRSGDFEDGTGRKVRASQSGTGVTWGRSHGWRWPRSVRVRFLRSNRNRLAQKPPRCGCRSGDGDRA